MNTFVQSITINGYRTRKPCYRRKTAQCRCNFSTRTCTRTVVSMRGEMRFHYLALLHDWSAVAVLGYVMLRYLRLC